MHTVVLSKRISLISRVSSIALLGGVLASCSSGFQRFDTSLYKDAIPQQTTQNPFPGAIDNRTTASVGSRLLPVANVAPRAVPQGVYHQPEPTLVAQQPANFAPKPYQPYVAPQQVTQPIRQPLSKAKTFTQTALPKPSAPSFSKAAVAQKAVTYVPPKPALASNAVYIPTVKADPIRTSSVEAVAPKSTVLAAANPSATNGGWNAQGGTTITVGQGETLYNLSKRYGVPVSAIRSANGMNSGGSLNAGQRIIIPNYTFSQSAGVSAPDNDPNTRAARASTGYLGEVDPSKAAFPTRRPTRTAAVSATGDISESKIQRYVPKGHSAPPAKETTPDHSIVTSSIAPGGAYTVQSGDTLSKIARNNGTTVAALQEANGITGSNIRLGQTLRVPGYSIDPVTTASVQTPVVAKNVKQVPANVDPVVTGSIKPNAVDTTTPAPARTGISNFRWPVQGRVVSTFGESGTNGANEGIDISVPEGTAVHAAENGVVIYAGDEISSYGKLILIRHDNDWVSAYAHNRDYEVKKGDKVRRGQIISRSGKTGNTSRPKVHFELRKDSSPVNPQKYLAG